MICRRMFLVLSLTWALAAGMSCTSGEVPSGIDVEGEVPPGNGVTEPPDGGAAPVDSAGLPADSGGAVPPDSAGGPAGDGGAVPPDSSGGLPSDSSGVPPDSSGVPKGDYGEGVVALLLCNPLPYATTTAVIGPNGGQLLVGDHVLSIPELALSDTVTITAEQMVGLVNSVRLSPEGLQFKVPAELTLSYKNCWNVDPAKRIAYTDEWLRIIKPMASVDSSSSKKVKSPIDHFSRYAVAY